MKYSSRVVIGKFIIGGSILFFSCIGMILVGITTKLALIALSWFQSGFFEILWSDIFYAAQLGAMGGLILGFGWVALYLFKVKGF
ncbi:hypothetical protein N4Q63_13635 [Leclercia adecarboxylata]|mgnify:CR=1 FL=1|uniref:Uncharacterized protein n=1 Tax=Leclercia adecarboxylata TaxID=83655 RepID=A0A9X4BEE1_9ENTR|nr:hypothetical protein [Leclercia adecarboxylata]MBD1401962.1 hypothetical protein [Leclercia adecarboxylata]MDC6622868.1 hypothetical protein [Leclercia adecarboxylata]MDC6634065.1 hypothetical protein [Leclercia adecarboxylata]MDC6639070.1 hypothetical protein [Leclercia adecarboxylata]MDC6649702.1 hypothetical protein [Leclercia adecarboxylata]